MAYISAKIIFDLFIHHVKIQSLQINLNYLSRRIRDVGILRKGEKDHQ